MSSDQGSGVRGQESGVGGQGTAVESVKKRIVKYLEVGAATDDALKGWVNAPSDRVYVAAMSALKIELRIVTGKWGVLSVWRLVPGKEDSGRESGGRKSV